MRAGTRCRDSLPGRTKDLVHPTIRREEVPTSTVRPTCMMSTTPKAAASAGGTSNSRSPATAPASKTPTKPGGAGSMRQSIRQSMATAASRTPTCWMSKANSSTQKQSTLTTQVSSVTTEAVSSARGRPTWRTAATKASARLRRRRRERAAGSRRVRRTERPRGPAATAGSSVHPGRRPQRAGHCGPGRPDRWAGRRARPRG